MTNSALRIRLAAGFVLCVAAIIALSTTGKQTEDSEKEKSVTGSTNLFNGEFVVDDDGIHTFAHFYRNPSTGRELVVVGMNHGGDSSYFDETASIFDTLDRVIYEGDPGSDKGGYTEEDEKGDRNALAGDDPTAAYLAAMRLFFVTGSRALGLVEEHSRFDYKKDGWKSADAVYFERAASDAALQKRLAEAMSGLSEIPKERQAEIKTRLSSYLVKIEAGTFTSRDFADGFVFLYSDEDFVERLLTSLGEPRDEVTIEILDQLLAETDDETIGIKFGAAHVSNLRRKIEERGFELVRSQRIKNIGF